MATQAIAAPVMGGLGRDADRVAEHNALLLAAQRRGRRGPTPEALFHQAHRQFAPGEGDRPGARSRDAQLRLRHGLPVVADYAVWMAAFQRHRMRLPDRNREAADAALEEQNRQLSLTKAQLADPARIDTMARNLGLSAPQPGQVVHPNAASDANTPAMAENRPAVPAVH